MITDAKISGQWVRLNSNLEPAMQRASNLMLESVQQNFLVGGRPDQWEPLKSGGPSNLYETGFMYFSIQSFWSPEMASVFIDTSRVPYAAIHNFGGVIKHPGSSKFQAFEYGGGTVFTHYTKPHDISMPQRQFMMFQEDDRTGIMDMIVGAIFSESVVQIQS